MTEINLMTAPIEQLQAIYNEAWRRHYNEIEPEESKRIMEAIDNAAFRRFYEITGKGGWWEFKPLFRKTNTNP